MNNMTVIDGFFQNPDEIRNLALNQEFYNKDNHPENIGKFPGMRTDYISKIIPELYESLVPVEIEQAKRHVDISKYTQYWTKFSFSYTTEGVGIGLHRDFKEGWEGYKAFFGGVIYLTPNPKKSSGTIVEEDIVDNVYNRYVMYDATCLHGLQDSFGETKKDARLVLTHFIYLK
jgi:hypothetical protein